MGCDGADRFHQRPARAIRLRRISKFFGVAWRDSDSHRKDAKNAMVEVQVEVETIALYPF